MRLVQVLFNSVERHVDNVAKSNLTIKYRCVCSVSVCNCHIKNIEACRIGRFCKYFNRAFSIFKPYVVRMRTMECETFWKRVDYRVLNPSGFLSVGNTDIRLRSYFGFKSTLLVQR